MADSTTHIIAYIANIRDVQVKVAELERLNKKAADALGRDFSKSIDILSNKLTGFKEIPIQVDGRDAIKTIQTFDTVTKTANGGVRTFTDTITRVNGAITGVTTSFREGGRVSRTFADDLTSLLKRAALTIPVWFAIRQGIASIFRTMRDGIHDLIEFDKLLQKTKFNLEGFAGDPAKAIDDIRERITQLSLETGVSTEVITLAFERFVSAGFDVETAFQGAIGAVQTSIALFGDAGQAADTFASAFKVLVDTSEDAIPPQQQIRQIFAQVAELAKTNVFTFEQFKESLEKFAGTAKTMNLTTQQTISILATLNSAALKGSRGGTLLRTTFNKLVGNLDEVASVLGIQVNPQLDTAFDVLIKVVDGVTELNKQSALAPEATKALSAIFDLRGTEVVRALIAVGDVLKQNVAITGDVQKFTKSVEDLNNSLSGQARIAGNIGKEFKKAFVTGLFGAKGLDNILQQITSRKDEIEDIGIALGVSVRTLGKIILAVPTLIAAIVSLGRVKVANPFDFVAESIEFNTNKANKAVEEFSNNLINAFQGKLSTEELKAFILSFEEQINKLKKSNKDFKISDAEISEDLKALQAQFKKQIEKQDITITPTVNVAPRLGFQEIQNISKLIVDSQLDSLKAQGATTSQLLRAEDSLKKQFGIYEQVDDVLKRQLDTERAITEEQRLRNSLSSESVRLFQIAQTEGVGIAKVIGEVLAGQRDFNTFVRQGGTALEVFKKNFGDIFEQQQAQAFFRGTTVPGLENLRGGGAIPIEEEAIRNRFPQFFNAQAAIQQRQVENIFPTVKAEINSRLEITIKKDKNVDVQIAEIMDEAASNPEHPVRQSVRTMIQDE